MLSVFLSLAYFFHLVSGLDASSFSIFPPLFYLVALDLHCGMQDLVA